MNRKLTDQDVLNARDLLRRGKTKTEVAKILDVSRRALGFALAREVPQDPAPPKAPVEEPEDRDLSAAELGLSPDAGASEIDEQIARCKRNQKLAESEGDYAEQRQQGNQIRQFLALKERIEAGRDPEAITIPRNAFAEIERAALTKLANMCQDRPQLCAQCSRALTVSWAQEAFANDDK